MKKLITLGLLSAFFIPNLVSFAEPFDGYNNGRGPEHGGGIHQMLRELDLNDDQKDQIHSIMEKHREAVKNDVNNVLTIDQREQLKAIMEDKKSQITNKKEAGKKRGNRLENQKK